MHTAEGKEAEVFELTSQSTGLTKRSKPTLIQLGNRLVPSDGRFHPPLCAEYIRDRGGRERWIPTGELARVFYGGNTPGNKKQIRRNMFRVWHALLNMGYLLVVDLSPRAGAQACKLYDPRSTEEKQYLQSRLERMQAQRFLKAEQLQRAMTLAECLEATVDPVPEV